EYYCQSYDSSLSAGLF
nr:immunoglobulin light chain junction region [Macaca mulatta]